MKVLNIVEAAYRGTLEEQDDTVIWICTAMKGANADVDVLLRGNAVNYAVKAQDAGGLSFGGREQTQPPKIADDVVRLKGQGAKIYVVEDALRETGSTRRIDRWSGSFPPPAGRLFGDYDQVCFGSLLEGTAPGSTARAARQCAPRQHPAIAPHQVVELGSS
jgi:hypothetical protein